mmetsp:Transcript_38020/g.100475  ORF Transcript_38020/g.100475 Transcript_38020/m.100475 type:complete len:267 (+) Transcript_38020:84-884(+)
MRHERAQNTFLYTSVFAIPILTVRICSVVHARHHPRQDALLNSASDRPHPTHMPALSLLGRQPPHFAAPSSNSSLSSLSLPRLPSASYVDVNVGLSWLLSGGGRLRLLACLLLATLGIRRRPLLLGFRLLVTGLLLASLLLGGRALLELSHNLAHRADGLLGRLLAHRDEEALQRGHRDRALPELRLSHLGEVRRQLLGGTRVELLEQALKLLRDRVLKLDMQINAAVANQCGIQALPVVGREDKDLAGAAADTIERVEQPREGED